MHRRVLAIADDLTGALEVGAKFAARSLDTWVCPPGARCDAAACVFDTESRHLSPEDASARVRETLADSADFYFKKTDSTLRGNIAAEFQAILRRLPGRPLIYAPAYPAMGRTVREGVLYVHGVPVAETGFAHDPLNPIHASEVPRTPGVTVVDGETDADLARIADCILNQGAIAAGTGALAGHLAAHFGPPAPPPRREAPSRCLVINGSLHPCSAAQAAAGTYDARWRLFDAPCSAGGTDRARRTGDLVCRMADEFDTLCIFGGDTAFGIVEALGSPPVQALGEILPGIPESRLGCLRLITKAGGFGPVDVLQRIRAILDGDA